MSCHRKLSILRRNQRKKTTTSIFWMMRTMWISGWMEKMEISMRSQDRKMVGWCQKSWLLWRTLISSIIPSNQLNTCEKTNRISSCSITWSPWTIYFKRWLWMGRCLYSAMWSPTLCMRLYRKSLKERIFNKLNWIRYPNSFNRNIRAICRLLNLILLQDITSFSKSPIRWDYWVFNFR